MRILVVGAGAVGGYFGGRLIESDRDVTFLVRPRRAAELTANGLTIISPNGNAHIKRLQTVCEGEITAPFDLVLLSCKAYDLGNAIHAFSPAVGSETVILPLLNGMEHLEILDRALGSRRVLGGLCTIVVGLTQQTVVQHHPLQSLVLGARNGQDQQHVHAIADAMKGCNFDSTVSGNILQDMWEKWIFLGSLAASCCLMRAPMSNIVAVPGGRTLAGAIIEECKAIAVAAGFPPRPEYIERRLPLLTEDGSSFAASMFRDVEEGHRVEADHVIGDLIARGNTMRVSMPLLQIAYTHLKVYEHRREYANRDNGK
ncbi:2-dehydropantoate 2-reductase [Bradyrhizobium sp. AZCC 2262]|uniref:2-dehydropantoate 2-reductase n=1 Tax=Bradyrhizobium sp. AZCC 2262 TaxID=3117022 RepID=UPI002FF0515C